MSNSFINVIERCDNFKLSNHRDELALFCFSGDPSSLASPIGLLWPEVVHALLLDNATTRNEGRKPSWDFITSSSSSQDPNQPHKERITHVHFAPHLADNTSRSAALAATCNYWRNNGIFAEEIGGRKWRNELYPIYKTPFCGLTPENIMCTIERSAAALFGIVTYGAHMTVFQRTKDGEIMVWVPTRAKTKQTWPGMLDNSVAGGISAGMSPFETIVKESMEEASLAEDIVRKHARTVGVTSYFFQKGKWLQPEVEYVYDLEIPLTATGAELERFRPLPLDGEVETFELLSLKDIIPRIHQELFKPNCALVLVDFMIRHGYITPETEPNYLEIVTRLHGRYDYSFWAQSAPHA
ncbi:uncharacterized protein FOMMEDRAFT_108903 [Fomitiporia mediterranea MF3/22]|uniref:uncharacterized protein n=1 Tax=Fomitiporia mediterranea (strain MF3/22) TaxID=694068 RepID=UPI00044099F6|nr:uncharacterized protein FOMMEDRAFT_108903 [Fomitiporia mediterranea MF3/22]EJD01888.1 hypothetical protein FOMMEDRAFT_108903 [Fomitiporia mediterranea MF3/22]